MPHTFKIPAKTEIAQLEPFVGLGLDNIHLVGNKRHADQALEELMASREIGFDTESKPTFRKGEKSTGPHVLQFSTPERAFIFQSHIVETTPALIELLASEQLVKIGFGLGGDMSQISDRFGMRPGAVIDLDRSFRQLGYRNAVGARSAVALLFQRRFLKSKSLTTSNWGNPRLSDAQLMYAANDAYAALMVYHALRERQDAPLSRDP